MSSSGLVQNGQLCNDDRTYDEWRNNDTRPNNHFAMNKLNNVNTKDGCRGATL